MRFIYLLAVVVGSLGAQPVVVELFPDGAPGTPGNSLKRFGMNAAPGMSTVA